MTPVPVPVAAGPVPVAIQVKLAVPAELPVKKNPPSLFSGSSTGTVRVTTFPDEPQPSQNSGLVIMIGFTEDVMLAGIGDVIEVVVVVNPVGQMVTNVALIMVM